MEYTVSEAVRRANAMRALQHGLYWKRRPIPLEVARRKLEEFLPPEAMEVLDAYISGDVEDIRTVRKKSLVKKAILRDLVAADIDDRGPVDSDAMSDRHGKKIGERIRAHPGLSALHWLDEQLDYTATAQRISEDRLLREQQLEAALEERLAQRRQRLAEFTSANQHRLPPASRDKGDVEHGAATRERGTGLPAKGDVDRKSLRGSPFRP